MKLKWIHSNTILSSNLSMILRIEANIIQSLNLMIVKSSGFERIQQEIGEARNARNPADYMKIQQIIALSNTQKISLIIQRIMFSVKHAKKNPAKIQRNAQNPLDFVVSNGPLSEKVSVVGIWVQTNARNPNCPRCQSI